MSDLNRHPKQGDGLRLTREFVKLIAVFIVVGALVLLFWHGGNFARNEPKDVRWVNVRAASSLAQELCGPMITTQRPLVVEIVYSEDIGKWIKFAADRFLSLCSNIQLKLTAMPDPEAAEAIATGRIQPALWMAADDLSIAYLEHRLSEQPGAIAPTLRPGEKTYLAQSPLVLLIWQDRLRVLSALLRQGAISEGQWDRGMCALVSRAPDLTGMLPEQMVPGSWADWAAPLFKIPPPQKGKKKGQPPLPQPAREFELPPLSELQSWGRVKLGHAKPTLDMGGLAAFYLMAYEYLLPPGERDALAAAASEEPVPAGLEQLAIDAKLARAFESAFAQKKDFLRRWLQRCEAGLAPLPSTTVALTTAFDNTKTALYDGVATFENLALPVIERLDEHGAGPESLALIYPHPTLIFRHPAVLLQASSEQKEAVHRWLQYLLSREQQEKAIEFGLRPMNSSVTLRGYDVPRNQFLRLRRYGVILQPAWTEAPRASGKLLPELSKLWGDATGRN
jgi:hypothetical protein